MRITGHSLTYRGAKLRSFGQGSAERLFDEGADTCRHDLTGVLDMEVVGARYDNAVQFLGWQHAAVVLTSCY
jgi:hypothetical protein